MCPHCSPSDTGPHAGCSTRPPWNGRCRGLRHTGLGWGVRTPRTRRRTAAPAGRLPPGIWVSGLASGQRSTDSSGAGGQTAPGLRSPQRGAPPRAHDPGGTARLRVGDHPRSCSGGPRATASPRRRQSQKGSLPGREGSGVEAPAEVPPVGGPRPSSLPHILSGYPWTPIEAASAPGSGPRPRGMPPIRGHRAPGGFPVQSGPPTFAPYPGGKGPSALQPAPSGRPRRLGPSPSRGGERCSGPGGGGRHRRCTCRPELPKTPPPSPQPTGQAPGGGRGLLRTLSQRSHVTMRRGKAGSLDTSGAECSLYAPHAVQMCAGGSRGPPGSLLGSHDGILPPIPPTTLPS